MKAILVAAVLLTGCSLNSHHVIERDMRDFVGKDVQGIVEKLGPPADEKTILGAKTYMWDINDCVLRVSVDTSERVTHFNYSGSHNDCGDMADKF